MAAEMLYVAMFALAMFVFIGLAAKLGVMTFLGGLMSVVIGVYIAVTAVGDFTIEWIAGVFLIFGGFMLIFVGIGQETGD